MNDLKQKRIVVTGSTSGIGRGIAEHLLKLGARVVINAHHPLEDHDRAALEKLGEIHYIQADLYRPEEACRLVEEASGVWGGLDGLVNNAGTYIRVSYRDSLPEHVAKLFSLNVFSGYFTSQAFAKVVGSRAFDAAIVNIGSTNSIQAERESVMYDASKGAILMMTRALAVTLAGQGIRVNCVGPGLIQTPLNDCAHENNPPLRALLHKQIPMRRTGVPSDVGGPVAFLLSQESAYITGQMLCVDGGIIAQQMTYEV